MVEELWRVDPSTLREVVIDRPAMLARVVEAPPTEQVWMLTVLGQLDEASRAGETILREAQNRYRPLLLLAYVRIHQFDWTGAAALHEEALQLARTPIREAGVRDQIGRRLFEQALYRDAANEFQWAADLRGVYGGSEAAVSRSLLARDRARALSVRGWGSEPG